MVAETTSYRTVDFAHCDCYANRFELDNFVRQKKLPQQPCAIALTSLRPHAVFALVAQHPFFETGNEAIMARLRAAIAQAGPVYLQARVTVEYAARLISYRVNVIRWAAVDVACWWIRGRKIVRPTGRHDTIITDFGQRTSDNRQPGRRIMAISGAPEPSTRAGHDLPRADFLLGWLTRRAKNLAKRLAGGGKKRSTIAAQNQSNIQTNPRHLTFAIVVGARFSWQFVFA